MNCDTVWDQSYLWQQSKLLRRIQYNLLTTLILNLSIRLA